jgi:polyhydroxyalkanoate synthesis regulator phasin
MEEPEPTQAANGAGATGQRSLEQLLLAGIGWVSLGAEAADQLADELGKRVGVNRDEMRAAVRDTVSSWRHDVERLGNLRSETRERALQRLGLVRREEADELALSVAQLEHRVRLLERGDGPPAA